MNTECQAYFSPHDQNRANCQTCYVLANEVSEQAAARGSEESPADAGLTASLGLRLQAMLLSILSKNSATSCNF